MKKTFPLHNIFTHYMDAKNLLYVIEIIGTFAFAISGVRLASTKEFDWFGAYVVGLSTAIGGGTIRDLLINVTPFWMTDYMYLIVTGFALLFVIFFGKYIIHMNNTIFIFDAIGLGLFVVVGVQKTVFQGYAYWVAIIMGTITGIAGSIIRDIFINEEPLVFRKDIYALTCVFGAMTYCLLDYLKVNPIFSPLACASAIIVLRILSTKYHWGLPVLKGDVKPVKETTEKKDENKDDENEK